VKRYSFSFSLKLGTKIKTVKYADGLRDTVTQILRTYMTLLRTTVYILSDSFIPCELRIKVANLVLCGIDLVWFPDDDPLWVETRRNIQSDIINI
jgi:hypothetical protein